MRHDGLTRVNFHDRQFLRPQDFVAEQIYHLIGHRRHNVGSHTWGIVAGLTLTEQEGSVYVEPGMAIDGYGRDLVVSRRMTVRTQTFDERLTSALHVWLIFGQDGSEGAPPGFGCIEPDGAYGLAQDGDSAEAIPPYRWREEPIVVLTDGRVEPLPRDAPDGVPTADVPVAPQRAFPVGDEPWGVYLGTVLRADPGETPLYTVNMDNRPYVGLVGWQVLHPAGAARIELGSETDATRNRRFAVFIAESDAGVDPRLEIEQIPPANPGDVPETTLSVRGHAAVAGNVSVENGSVAFAGTPDYDDARREGQLYRCTGEDPDSSLDTDELRIEMGATQPSGRNRVAIGKWDAGKKRFEPCLTVTDECLVTVHGNLVVEGAMTAQQGANVTRQYPQVASFLTSLRSNVAANALTSLRAVSARDRLGVAAVQDAIESQPSLKAVAEDLVVRSPSLVDRLIDELVSARQRARPAEPN